ncbi:class II fructose-bisphosphate aldolase [Acetonema longum]|uniref:Fructose-bisphosphate aldolase n=1 Tax=Acetonema longum DSM 6540 TaxID=1009370 RepID=F7NLR5_9FIRM|nr:class II fructose-bisphosphate aldolase [Acetonema longum]EGO63006.1 fructose-bisphosphate aldolase [Acetonema longum DSM 6540]
MPLVTLREILQKTDQSDYGVGSFNVVSMEMVMGVIRAAEETFSPIILQTAEARLKHSPLNLIGPLMVEAACKAKVPVAVHLDHGSQLEIIKQALEIGFTSVMFDGSRLPLAVNITKTLEVARLAQGYGASVEAEIGRVGGSEDGAEDIEMAITQVQDAQTFFEHTGVDALAVAIGNVHGVYKREPNLQFARLKDIHAAVAAPLVLHGGSGITAQDFRQCIQHGIKKINVQTATLHKVVAKVRSLFQQTENPDYFTYHECVIAAAHESAKDHMEAFQSVNQAW